MKARISIQIFDHHLRISLDMHLQDMQNVPHSVIISNTQGLELQVARCGPSCESIHLCFNLPATC